MRTSFCNLPLLEHQDKVCVLYRREPVGNHQNRFVLGQPLKSELYLMFIFGICKCCGFIQYNNRGVFKIALARAIL